MNKREHFEGLMAASLYEPLSASEQRELDAWLAVNPGDRAEFEALRKLTGFLPNDAPAFTGDLRPLLREEILRGAGRGFEWSMAPRLFWQLAGALAVTAVLVLPVMQGARMGFLSGAPEQLARLNAPIDSVSENARALMRQGDFTEAHKFLSANLAAQPDDPFAGKWQQALASLEFEHFQRYAQAFDAYQKLRTEYGAEFASDPSNAFRFDLLEQTREDHFAPLDIIAAASHKGMDGFEDLERVAARYSGRGNPVAQLALNAMTNVAGALDTPSGVFQLAAYEKVRRRCTDPLVIAQLNDSLGQLYLEHTGNVERARQLFEENADCDDTPFASHAQMALARLEPQPR